MSSSEAVGIFDSGLGGLTVLAAIQDLLPNENLIYFGDTARVPYGTKSRETIIHYSEEILEFLLSRNVKAVVVACNTASAHALEKLQRVSPVPVIGVVEPGIRACLRQLPPDRKAAVIATRSTVKSSAYEKGFHEHGRTVLQRACPLFVPMIEEGYKDKKAMELVIHDYLEELRREEVSHVILGCTHYPILLGKLKELYPEFVFINPADEVAAQLQEVLSNQGALNSGKQAGELHLFVSDITDSLRDLQYLFLGQKIHKIHHKNLEW